VAMAVLGPAEIPFCFVHSCDLTTSPVRGFHYISDQARNQREPIEQLSPPKFLKTYVFVK